MLFLDERLSNESRNAGTLTRGGQESFGSGSCVALSPSTDVSLIDDNLLQKRLDAQL